MARFDDKIALVTGATAGFGRAIARRLHSEGARVVITGRREERLATLAEELGDRVTPLSFDVRDRAAVTRALESLSTRWSAIDLLVNNAGLALGLESAWEANPEDWDTMIDTNVRGLLNCTRQILPGMIARGRGHVVQISSISGTYPYPGGHVYGATKAFVNQFSRNLRADLVGHPVRVTTIEPGLAETEFSLVRFKGDAERAETTYRGIEALTAEDIAETVAWVWSLPPHVNVNRVELMPTHQAAGGLAVARRDPTSS